MENDKSSSRTNVGGENKSIKSRPAGTSTASSSRSQKADKDNNSNISSNSNKKENRNAYPDSTNDVEEDEEEGLDEPSEEEEEEEDLVSESSGMGPWVCNFCSMVGHEFFTEVTEDFIEDEFNLTGLSSLVSYYKEALELILDLEPEVPPKLPAIPVIEQSAENLYGLIHARFILTRQGLQDMAEKYENSQFGVCPRYLCKGSRLLPVGRHDRIGYETVRLYCPCCQDLYMPVHSRHLNIDGAFFGTSFPGMFLDAYPEIERRCKQIRYQQFELKIYGFRISELSQSGARMKWLRQQPLTVGDLLEFNDLDEPSDLGSDEYDEIIELGPDGRQIGTTADAAAGDATASAANIDQKADDAMSVNGD